MPKRRFSSVELAGFGSDPYLYGALPTFGGKTRMHSRDRLLVEKGGSYSDSIELYMDLLLDNQVYFGWDKQMSEITSRDLIIEAGGEEPIDQAARDYVEGVLDNLSYMQEDENKDNLAIVSNAQGINGLTRGLGVSMITGVGFAEIIWYRDRAYNPSIKKVIVRDPRRFFFEYKDNEYFLKLITKRHSYDGIYVPSRKFIVHRHYAIPNDDVYGSGLGRLVYYPVQWKKELLTLWLTIVDKYSDPTAIGTYSEDISPEVKAEFEAAVSSISRDMWISMPDIFKLEFSNPNLKNADLLEKLERILNTYISKVILGEARTGEQDVGGNFKESISNSIRLMKAKSFSEEISNTLNSTLVKWLTLYKFGTKAKPPKIKRNFQDVETTIGLLTQLKQLGYNTTPEYIENLTGIPFQQPKQRKKFSVG